VQQTYLSKKSSLLYFPSFFKTNEADGFFYSLSKNIKWQKTKITLFGKSILEPRLVAFYGDKDVNYKYSGSLRTALPWNDDLLGIQQSISPLLEEDYSPFNSALLNFYRDGRDHMGWHSDNEIELGKNPLIFSLNLGATRKMSFRCQKQKSQSVHDIMLEHGSLLIMKGAIQHEFQHCIRKTTKVFDPRINITFRTILN